MSFAPRRPDDDRVAHTKPMSADRVRREHIQHIYELSGHNVSKASRQLNMHRRTLQRILARHPQK